MKTALYVLLAALTLNVAAATQAWRYIRYLEDEVSNLRKRLLFTAAKQNSFTEN